MNAKIEATEKRLNDEAAKLGWNGTFLVSEQKDGRWMVQYCEDRTRLVTNKQPSLEAALERSLLWMMN